MKSLVKTVMLIPSGSSSEEIRGISHLFEHLLLLKLGLNFPRSINGGYTTEDYITLFSGNKLNQLLSLTCEAAFEKDDLTQAKIQVSKEIELKGKAENEFFFRSVWKDSRYQNSPLGTIESVENIFFDDIEVFRERLLKKTFYFFDNNDEFHLINNGQLIQRKNEITPYFKILNIRQFQFNNKGFRVFYFSDHVEEIFFLFKILECRNPGKRIVFSEKRHTKALICEAGTELPANSEIANLTELAMSAIKREICQTKSNFMERAINELESHFFYNKKWEDRIKKLTKISTEQIEYYVSLFLKTGGFKHVEKSCV